MNSVIQEWVGHVCNVGKFPREGSMLQTWAVPFWFLRGVFMNSVIPEWVGHVCNVGKFFDGRAGNGLIGSMLICPECGFVFSEYIQGGQEGQFFKR